MMSLWGFKPYSQVVGLAVRGMGMMLGTVALMGGSGAIAAPLFPSANQTAPVAQQPQTDSDDVIVDSDGSAPGTPSGNTLANTRFTCEYRNGQYVVMYHPESQPGQSYPWANPTTMGGGWTPERRCGEISRRLESYRPDGLQEMRTSVENGYDIICVTTQKVSNCRIVLTVPPGQDPLLTRDRVFQNLTIADGGQQTQAVNTFVEGRSGNGIIDALGNLININVPALSGRTASSDAINLRPFLDRADGGTGTYLRGGTSNRPSPRLNPDRFR